LLHVIAYNKEPLKPKEKNEVRKIIGKMSKFD
jgi:hypothetical protein